MPELHGMQRIGELFYIILAREPWKGHHRFRIYFNGTAVLDSCRY
jgi:hypothetical protein